MKYRTRTYYTDAQKALMWERWKQGWTLHQIAQLFDRAHTSVQGILGADWWHPTSRSGSRARMALTLGRARGDLACGGGRPVDSLDRCTARASAIDSQPRDQAQRRSSGLSGEPKPTAPPGIERFVPSAAN